MIQQKFNVYAYEVDNWTSFGDPFELELYYYWSEFFNDQK
jgi:hypothetical protein